MIEPVRATVRPRVRLQPSGEVVLLEDVVAEHLAVGQPRTILLCGEVGAGMTTALQHLAHQFAGEPELRLEDRFSLVESPFEDRDGLILIHSREPQLNNHVRYRLAGWGRDEWIEYLLAVHHDRCASVMHRVEADPNRDDLEGNPSLWRRVLDELAADEDLKNVRAALQRLILKAFPDDTIRHLAGWRAFQSLAPLSNALSESDSTPFDTALTAEQIPLLKPVVIWLMAAETVSLKLSQSHLNDVLCRQWPRSLVKSVAPIVAGSPVLQTTLRELLALNRPEVHAASAALLHASGIGWKPDPPQIQGVNEGRLDLSGASFAGAVWSGVDLNLCHLQKTDFQRAKLEFAIFNGAFADSADFRHADMRNAQLSQIRALAANFCGANLESIQGVRAYLEFADLSLADLTEARLIGCQLPGANLRDAILRRANLAGTNFTEAVLDGADFTDADLELANLSGLDLTVACFERVRFTKANLERCDLENMELPGAVFVETKLAHALLTGSIMPNANFSGANLYEAGLADVDWEFANLRNADLSKVSFHMGSTRDGLVGSTIPMHGSRTGFYTDDYNEQDFKAPEEIRKANLRGADLRGAIVEYTDFYLVDLRDALYDAKQEQHFRRCGAILESKAKPE